MSPTHSTLAALALLASGAMTSAHAAQGVSLASGFTDFTTWDLYGSATASGDGATHSELTLTSGVGDEAGAGFAPAPITLDYNLDFTFDFHFIIPPSTELRGDGLTFTLAGTPGVGTGGSDLGYGGLGSDSVAFAIDTFNFDGEPVSPSIQILSGGSVTPLAAAETALGGSIRDPAQWYAHVDYIPSGVGDDKGTLMGTIEHPVLGSFSVSASVDFSALGMAGVADVYYGFTAGNGLAKDAHIITSAVPEPASWALLLAGLGLVGFAVRRAHPWDVVSDSEPHLRRPARPRNAG